MKRAGFLMVLALIVSVFTSCQPTPDKDVVVNKSGNELMNIIENQQGTGGVNSPEHWIESFETESIYVNVDADIYIPEVSQYPVLQAEPDNEVPVALIKALSKYLMGDEPIWSLQSPLNLTKTQLEQVIFDKKETLKDFEQHIVDRGYTEFRDDSIRRNLNEWIEEASNEYETAPEKYDAAKADFEWKTIESRQSSIELFTLNEDNTEQKSELSVFKYSDSAVLYYNRDFRKLYVVGPVYKGQNLKLDVTFDEAKGKTGELLSIISRETGDDYRIASEQIGYRRPSYLDPSTYENIENYKQCYAFSIACFYNDIPAYNAQDVYGDNNEQYEKPWFPEEFTVYVDDGGIAQLMWNGKGRVTQTISKDVYMLSFEEIQDRFREHMKLQWAYLHDDSSIIRTDLNIDRITLGMMRVIDKDNPGEYLMIPVWDFFGRLDLQYDELNNHSDTISNELSVSSFLTINAIDGSIINRGLGY